MANILVVDSSTEACSVALSYAGKSYTDFQLAPRKHAELLLPMVDQLLSRADIELTQLDAIGCCIGPGAFTGLRIAISMTQGLALASQLTCVAVTSLEALAYQAFKTSHADYCLAAIDARMDQVYFAVFKRDQQQFFSVLSEPQVINPELISFDEALLDEIAKAIVVNEQAVAKVGNGWEVYEFAPYINDLAAAEISKNIKLPQAKYMLDLAQLALKNTKNVSPEGLQPLYLRNNVAKKSKNRL